MYDNTSLSLLYQHLTATTKFTRSRKKHFFAFGVAIFIFGLWSLLWSPQPRIEVTIDIETSQPTSQYVVGMIESMSKYFLDYPLGDDKFGEMGRRVELFWDSTSITGIITSLEIHDKVRT